MNRTHRDLITPTVSVVLSQLSSETQHFGQLIVAGDFQNSSSAKAHCGFCKFPRLGLPRNLEPQFTARYEFGIIVI